MTFIGFSINKNRDLIDPVTRKVIHKQLLTRQLLVALEAQGVTFSNNGSNTR